ncbi:MAG: MBL fold metallo-hydrolase [Myxococcota bacterium]
MSGVARDRLRVLTEAHREARIARASRGVTSRPLLAQWWDSLIRGTRPAAAIDRPRGAASPLEMVFVGHATVLLRFGSVEIVTDPFLGRWLCGLRRARAPGLGPADLRGVRMILLSHAHLDHLDRASLRELPRAATIVMPPRCADLVSDLGFSKVVELDGWQSHHAHGLEVIAVPARHWGRRVPLGRRRGFCGYLVRASGIAAAATPSVYFAGDTGWFDGFAEIGRRYRPDVALLPIGAYDPPSFRRFHMSPLDAVEAFADLGARTLVPVHFGSFTLSCEPLEEPAEWLAALAAERGLTQRVRILENGQSTVMGIGSP